ncbi:MAG: ABC transporter ATP-binding protein [Anaerolineaceae bacterium]|nr:ABC transporter ATP-binding protein [Anaerolineaceae bacterium]
MPDSYYEEEEFETRFNGKIFSRILQLTAPHKKWVIGFMVTIGIVAGLDAVSTYLSKMIIDNGILAGNKQVLVNILIMYSALILVQSGSSFLFIYLAGILGERIRYDLRKKMFNHLQMLSLNYYSKTPVGWIMARVTSDSEKVADLLTWGFVDSTWGIMSIGTSMVFMLIINWKLSLFVVALLPILFYVALQFQKRILVSYRSVRKTNSKIVGAYNENITGVRVIKALGREKENLAEFSQLTDQMYHSSFRAAWLSALFLPTVQIISAMAVAAVVWYGGYQAQVGGLSIGGIQAFVSYITFMMWPIQDIARVFAEMQQAIASAERMFSLIDSEPQIKDRPKAIDPGTISGDIIFDHVTFHYEEDGKPVLDDFSLHVKRGETLALVGPTGGGKSTIVNLLCRFYEPQAGRIFIGGRDYTSLSLQAIQSRIGVVLQTPHLFSGTIAENLRYGRLAASDEDIIVATKTIGAYDFIMHFEKGFDTQVGEGGNLLSVGQKQLLSLARAVLANPEIFVMDEATSSVDTLTESLIQKGMQTLLDSTTSFIIAHRLSTIKKADRILVIEEGKIAEMGSHAELLRRRGKYYQLYTRQFRSQLEATFNPFQDIVPSAE